MVNIGFVMPGSLKSAGGVELFANELMAAMSNRGHRLTVFATGGSYFRNIRYHRRLPFTVVPMPVKPLWLRSHIPWVMRAYFRTVARTYGIDVWHVFGAYPAMHILSSAKDSRPTVVTTYGADIQKFEKINYGARMNPQIETEIIEALSYATVTTANTPRVSEDVEYLGVPAERIRVIPVSVDTERFKILDSRQARGQSTNPIIRLLTVGRNHPKKRFDLIPKIAQELQQRDVVFEWKVVGRGVSDLRADVDKYGCNDTVRLIEEIGVSAGEDGGAIGTISDALVELYAQSDIFVLPSDLETFGKVLAEALASGVPAVTTDAVGCGEVIEHGVTGLIAPVGDVLELASAVEKLANDQELRNRLGANGPNSAKKWHINEITQQYENLYRKIISFT
jgi:glycosyltransferase involved in cell wall biosynthesis